MQLHINTPDCILLVKRDMLHIVRPDGEQEEVPLRVLDTLFLSRKAQIAAEVLFAAVEHDIDVQFVDGHGQPRARLWANRYGSISVIRKQQLAFSMHPDAIGWVKELLAEKLDNQCATLLAVQTTQQDYLTQPAMEKIGEYRRRVLDMQTDTMGEAGMKLRPLEGAASKVYFQVLSQLLPPQYRFAVRSQHPATDMFNSLLNYTYGMLYGKVETALIRAGLDPFVGIFHRDEYNRPVFTWDFIERFRAWADFTVMRLCQQEVIFVEFFDIDPNGAFFLNTYGKRILIQSFADYMDEVILYRDLERSRDTHLELQAQAFASFLKSRAS